jgi:hypothetical protein
LGLAAVLVLVMGFVVIRQNAARLEDEAERAMPGPLADPCANDSQVVKPRGDLGVDATPGAALG